MSRFLALAAVVLISSGVLAADPKPVVGLGIVSADEKLVFLPGKDGVEAVELATGKQVWASKDAKKIAGASDKVVVGWVAEEKKANIFRVVAFDAATGKTLGKSDPIALPDWASVEPTYGRTFRTAAKAGDDAVTVFWQANAFYAGGARPTPEIEEAARKNERGLVKVDIKTGKVAVADGKPKDDDFKAGPAGGFEPKAAGYEFQQKEE
ncbi:MAG: hypothetical protein K2V38_20180, partial [Gemmataceae bacterium]|nr:hypothetical protein [Gemmataceae bacterium]